MEQERDEASETFFPFACSKCNQQQITCHRDYYFYWFHHRPQHIFTLRMLLLWMLDLLHEAMSRRHFFFYSHTKIWYFFPPFSHVACVCLLLSFGHMNSGENLIRSSEEEAEIARSILNTTVVVKASHHSQSRGEKWRSSSSSCSMLEFVCCMAYFLKK